MFAAELFRNFFFGLLFIWAAVPARGQLADFNVQVLGEADGIRTSNILKMVRDKQGFLWMLSPRYIQRFDGLNVKRFDTKGEDLLDLTADQDGKVWVSTQSTLKRFENDLKGFQDIEIKGPLPTKFNVLQISSDNQVWAISGKGLFRYDRGANAFVHHDIPGLEKQLFYRKIFQRCGNEFFTGDTHQLFSFNTKTKRLRSVAFESVLTIVPFSEDILWATNSRFQVFELNFATGTAKQLATEHFYPRLASDFLEIIGIVPLTPGQYLVNTTQGTYKYDRAKQLFQRAALYHFGRELPNNEITTSYVDNEGLLWVLGQQGIIFFKPTAHTINWLRTYREGRGEGNNNIKAITADAEGNIWMATSFGVSRLDTQTGEVNTFHPGKAGSEAFQFPSVQGLVFDGTNLILGPGAGGPLIFNPVTKTFKSPAYPPGNVGKQLRRKVEEDYIYSILRLQNGDHMVLGDLGCYLLQNKTYKISELAFPGSNYILQCAVQQASGNIWLGTYRGLVEINSRFQTVASDTIFKPSRLITSLLPRNDSTVWAGSVGIFEVIEKGNRLSKKQIIPELANQQITMLYRDENGKIWIGADDGLYRFSENDKKLEWFDIWDNVQNKQINPGSVFKTADGTIYLGGNNGLNYFNPTKIEPKRQQLNVIVTGVSVNQNDSLYLFRRPLVLDWNENSVEMQFVAIYFQNAQKVRYRYRLAGLDTGWVYNGRINSVRFSSLAPGDYTFTVAASLDGISWQEINSPFRFSIKPPIWKTWWFVLLAITAAICLTYYLFRLRIASIQKQQAAVFALQTKAQALEKEKAMAMYEGLKQQLNPHFLFNSLTSLDSLIFIDQKLASRFLEKLSHIYRYILKNRDHELVALSDEIKFAREYIDLQKARFEDGLIVNLQITGDFSSCKIAPVTLQNLIENAIKHNIIALDAPLVIDIYCEGNQLVVRNNLNKKKFVETSNRQGLKNLQSFYRYLSHLPVEIIEEEAFFTVKIPLI